MLRPAQGRAIAARNQPPEQENTGITLPSAKTGRESARPEHRKFIHETDGFRLAIDFRPALMDRQRQLTNVTIDYIMAKALSKSQIAAEIATKNNITKKAATEILEHIAALSYKHAKDSFTIPGLGKLVLVNRKARVGRNPATGEAIKIKASKKVAFRVAKDLKEAV